MAAYFRIVQKHWAASAMSGEGARLYGGRWNPEGMSAVYLAESRALAALEIVVHAPREALLLDWCLIEVDVPDDQIKQVGLKNLPDGWDSMPFSRSARKFGEAWLGKGTGLALKLPSVIVPEEHTLMINPLHARMAGLRPKAPRAFRFDKRLGKAD